MSDKITVKPTMIFGVPEELMPAACKLVGWDGYRMATEEDMQKSDTITYQGQAEYSARDDIKLEVEYYVRDDDDEH